MQTTWEEGFTNVLPFKTSFSTTQWELKHTSFHDVLTKINYQLVMLWHYMYTSEVIQNRNKCCFTGNFSWIVMTLMAPSSLTKTCSAKRIKFLSCQLACPEAAGKQLCSYSGKTHKHSHLVVCDVNMWENTARQASWMLLASMYTAWHWGVLTRLVE